MADTSAVTANPLMMAKALRSRQVPRPDQGMHLARALFSNLPVIGDVAGAAWDVADYVNDPSTRGIGNYAMTLASLLPGIPSLKASVWRGGRAPADGMFFSRDPSYAKGFDKGDYRQYKVEAESALDLNRQYPTDALQPVVRALGEVGDVRAAKEIGQALAEDGGAVGGHLYQWLGNLSSRTPEEVLRRAGIDAIDTGRDLVVLNKGVVTW